MRAADEDVFRAAHEEMVAEEFDFGLGVEPGMAWADCLQALADRRAGVDLPDGIVPETFLVAEVDGMIVGRTSIRHRLNDFLLREGGHIGYGVLRRYRRRGYATQILRQSLVVARAEGVDRVLVTCDDDNVGSRTVIESCGGKLDSTLTSAESSKRRYWID